MCIRDSDRTDITLRDGWPVASAPPTIRGRIEARGIGILAADPAGPAPLVLVVDLDTAEQARMPPPRQTRVLTQQVPLLHKVESVHFAAAIMQYLKAGPALM